MAKDFLTIDPRKLELIARQGSATIVADVTLRTAALARRLAPGKMGTKVRPIVTMGANPLGIVMVEHPAASFVLEGTKPHEIRPRVKSVLRFEIGGSTVYAKLVHHPGTKANDFLLKALTMSRYL